MQLSGQMRLLILAFLQVGLLFAQSSTPNSTRLDTVQLPTQVAMTSSANVFQQTQGFANGVTIGSGNNWLVGTDTSGNFVIQNGSGSPLSITGTTGIPVLTSPQIVTSGTQPTCAAGYEGVIWYAKGGASGNGSLQVCQNQSGNYSWVATVNAAQAALSAPVQSVGGRNGNVTLTHTDILDWSTAIGAGTGGTVLASDASIVNLGSAYSVGGLVNVLSYSGGIPINDGTVHRIGTAPAGTPFYGVTTLAGIASISINGAKPFSWITSQTTPFSFQSDVYNLNDSKAAQIDIAWLAIQTGLLNGKLYTPAGTYIVGSMLPLPLFVPGHSEASGQYQGAIFWNGDGPRNTLIRAGSDWGAGYSLISCGDPKSAPGSGFGRYNAENYTGDIKNVGFVSSASQVIFAPGSRGINMDGIAWGSRLRMMDVEASGFNHDITIVGDHTDLVRLHLYGGAIGLYLPPAGPNFGDLAFTDFRSENQSIAAIGVSNSATFSATMEGQTYLQAPYGIYGEADTGGNCTDIANRLDIHNLMAEYIGNALFQDDTGFSNGIYNDAKKCRSVTKTQIGDLFFSWGAPEYWSAGGRQRRAAVDLGSLGLHILDLECDAGCWTPNSSNYGGGSGSTPIATINVNSLNAVRGIRIDGDISRWISAAGTLPLIGPALNDSYTGIQVEDSQGWGGYIWRCGFGYGNHNVASLGDLVETNVAGCAMGGSNPANTVLGIVAQGGVAASSYIPIATHGIAQAATGWIQPGVNYATMYKKATGIGRSLDFAPGTGGTNGTFAWASSGGGCTVQPAGTFTVTNGAISAYSITIHGSGCTSSPAITASTSPGLTGASLTPLWPSGLVTVASGYNDGPIVGTYHYGGGLPPNYYANLKLVGLQ